MGLTIRHMLPGHFHLPTAIGMSTRGGVVNGTLAMSGVQVRLGHRVEVVGGTSQGRATHYRLGEVAASCLPSWEWARLLRWNLSWLAPTWWYSIRSQPVDVLHVHEDPNLLLLPKGRVRVLHLRTALLQPLDLSYQRLLSRADAVIANSDFVRNRFLAIADYPDDRVFRVYNGADFSSFSSADGSRLRSSLRAARNSLLLLYVGAVVPEKGTLYLAQAMKRIAPRFPEITLVIVGGAAVWLNESTYEEEVRRHCEGMPVKFLGPLPHAEMPSVYAACDLVILPSICEEAFGLVLCEAMAAGKPVVASSVGGIPEVVGDGETGYLVPPKDISALVRAIELLASDPILRETMGQAARERAKRFTWENTVRGLDKVYSIASERKRRCI